MENSKKHGILWLSILTGILAGLFLKLFVLDVLHISGSSMEPTLHNHSKVFVNKLAYGLEKPFRGTFFFQWAQPERGDIVIFLHDNKIVVKRCVAVSGDKLEFSQDTSYYVNVNQQKISLNPVQYNMMKSFSSIPEGYIFALGDNSADSIDSRDYGFVSAKNIMGKVIGK